jgi:hypothetical protein
VSKLAEAWTFKLTGPAAAGVTGYGSAARRSHGLE